MPKTRYILNGNPVLELTSEEHDRVVELLKIIKEIYGVEKGHIKFHRNTEKNEDEITITMSTKIHLFPDDSLMYS